MQAHDVKNHEHADSQVSHTLSGKKGISVAPPSSDSIIQQKLAEAENTVSSGLETGTKHDLENYLNTSLDHVQVHNNVQSRSAAQVIQAKAFTSGNHIFYGNELNNATGTERKNLLAHEVVHTLQQKNAAPGIQEKSAIGQPDTVHEREADRIADGFTKFQHEGYRSPALQMRSAMPVTPLSGAAVQRSVSTFGGDWDTTKYDLITPASAAGRRGAEINLKFTPGPGVNAELIGLTQSSKAINRGSVTFIGDPTRQSHGISAADAVTNPVTGQSDEGTHIDQSGSNRNPLYAVEGAPAADTNLYDTLPTAGNMWGQHGFRFTDGTGTLKQQDALLNDTPAQPNVAKDSSNIFEVAAVALKGAQQGTYYGSVSWGWQTDSSGAFTKLPLTVGSQGVPTSSFMKAAENWNSGTTSSGAATLDMPIVDVKLTTASISQAMPAGFVGPAFSIPTGTRVQITRPWHPPFLNAEIKVVDGPFTGRVMEVDPADMANIVDERP